MLFEVPVDVCRCLSIHILVSVDICLYLVLSVDVTSYVGVSVGVSERYLVILRPLGVFGGNFCAQPLQNGSKRIFCTALKDEIFFTCSL